MRTRFHSTAIDSTTADGVERGAEGKAPVAFRIWRAGENVADDGSIFFTSESAEALMAEQESRGRPLSIDFDHLSLMNDRPAEAGRAAGWHRLETRDSPDGPELWAVDVEWSPDVRAGLEEEPPRWRFFSPAFRTDEDNEVTSYINLALCINPMTHGIPLLASRKLTKETPMTAEEMLSQLDALIEATEDPDKKAALVAAREALAAKKGDDPPADAPVNTDSDKTDGDDKKDDDEEKKAAVVTHATKDLDEVTKLAAKVVALERRDEVREIDALLSKHPNLPEEFKAHCRKGTLADAKVSVAAVVGAAPKVHAARNERPAQGSTLGSSEIDPMLGDAMDRAMGIKSATAQLPHKDSLGRFIMHNIRPSDLARLNAQKGKA